MLCNPLDHIATTTTFATPWSMSLRLLRSVFDQLRENGMNGVPTWCHERQSRNAWIEIGLVGSLATMSKSLKVLLQYGEVSSWHSTWKRMEVVCRELMIDGNISMIILNVVCTIFPAQVTGRPWLPARSISVLTLHESLNQANTEISCCR